MRLAVIMAIAGLAWVAFVANAMWQGHQRQAANAQGLVSPACSVPRPLPNPCDRTDCNRVDTRRLT